MFLIEGVQVAKLAAYDTQNILCEADKYVRRSLNETGLQRFYVVPKLEQKEKQCICPKWAFLYGDRAYATFHAWCQNEGLSSSQSRQRKELQAQLENEIPSSRLPKQVELTWVCGVNMG